MPHSLNYIHLFFRLYPDTNSDDSHILSLFSDGPGVSMLCYHTVVTGSKELAF